MNVVVLAGGVGGARFLRGMIGVVDPATVAIIGNVADDVDLLGLSQQRSGRLDQRRQVRSGV